MNNRTAPLNTEHHTPRNDDRRRVEPMDATTPTYNPGPHDDNAGVLETPFGTLHVRALRGVVNAYTPRGAWNTKNPPGFLTVNGVDVCVDVCVFVDGLTGAYTHDAERPMIDADGSERLRVTRCERFATTPASDSAHRKLRAAMPALVLAWCKANPLTVLAGLLDSARFEETHATRDEQRTREEHAKATERLSSARSDVRLCLDAIRAELHAMRPNRGAHWTADSNDADDAR